MRLVTLFTVLTAGMWFLTWPAMAQAPATQPASTAPGTQPAKVDEAYLARVVEVVREASYSVSGKAGPWQAAKVGDLLPAGTWVRTQLRSRLVLAFGPDTVTVIQPYTLASIDQFHRAGDAKVVRLGLGHGLVRAGASEATLRCDMTIETPTATLSKRGTMDFGIQYTPPTMSSPGRFRVFLDREGLVQAMNKMTGQSRTVLPGQYVTQAMQRWIDTATQDRWVAVVDTYGMTDAETLFNQLQDTGLGVVEPGGGSEVLAFSGTDAGALAAQLNAQRLQQGAGLGSMLTGGPGFTDRPEGNFGTGSGMLQPLSKHRLKR